MTPVSLWAWIATPAGGKPEYIVGAVVGDVAMPLVSAQRRLIDAAEPIAKEHGRREGVCVRVVRFVEAPP